MEKTMGYSKTVKTTVATLVVALFFIQGLMAQVPAGAKPVSVGTKPAVAKHGAVPGAKNRKMLPLMEKLPPLPPKPKKPQRRLYPATVIVRVNGVDITKGMIDRQAELMTVLLKNKSKTITPVKLRKFKKENYRRFSNELFMRTMIDSCLASSNIVVSEEMKTSVEKAFALRYGASREQKLETIKEIVAKAGYLKELETQLAFEAKYRTFLTTVCSNRYYVTDEQVAKVKKDVQEYNARSNATNEFNFAEAKKMSAKAKEAGVDFAKLADQYSQDPEKKPGGYLGESDESDYADEPHVWRAVSRLKAGGVTEALELENGYGVFKVISIKSAEESTTGAVAYELARIFYRKAYVFPAQTDAEFRADVEGELREKLNKDLIRAFRKQSKVERPNGNVDVQ